MDFKQLHRNIKIRLFTSFFQRLVNQMIIPFMTIYLAKSFGVVNAGIMVFFLILIGILVSFYGGYFADLKGRKPVLLISESLNFIVFLSLAFSNSPWFHLPLISYILFILNNCLTSFSKPALDAIIIDVTSSENRRFIYSLNYWVNNLSFAIGALLGSLFYTNYLFEIFLGASLVTFFVFILFYFFLDETKVSYNQINQLKINHSINKIFEGYRLIIKDKLFLLFFVSATLLMCIEFQLINYVSVRLSTEFESFRFYLLKFEKEISGVELYGILRIENTIGVLLFTILISKLLKNISDQFRLYFGISLFILGYVFLGFNNNFYILIFMMAILTIGEIMYIPIQQTFMADLIDEDNRTKYLAFFGLHQKLGLLLASLFVTLSSYFSSYVISLSYLLIGVMILLIYKKLFYNEIK